MSTVLQQQPQSPSVDATRRFDFRSLLWSIRREVWENRSVYIAPICAALVILFGFSVGATHITPHPQGIDPEMEVSILAHSLDPIAAIIMLTTLLVSFFYCLDALFTERRDRSILFWKSLPVSDLTTVLSKASIPLVVIPVIAFVVILVTQVIVLTASMLMMASRGADLGYLWSNVPFGERWLNLIYGEFISALWFAPVYAWLLLISAWAQRLPFLWAVLPPLGLIVIEWIGFHTYYVAQVLGDRIVGAYTHGFIGHIESAGKVARFPSGLGATLDPASFFSTPALWIGLALAIGCLAAAVWLRRYREAI